MRNQVIFSSLMVFAMAGAAFANTTATANTDLNIRDFPDSSGAIVGLINSGDSVVVEGCIDEDSWCKVEYGPIKGWSSGDYLNATLNQKIQPLYPNRQAMGVAVIERPTQTRLEGAETGGVAGAAIGALVAGPVGAVVGAAIGGEAGAANARPSEDIVTFVNTHPVEPVHLRGEIVVGAGIPENIRLYDIPNQPHYKYLLLNGRIVLVNPESRQIVYIPR